MTRFKFKPSSTLPINVARIQVFYATEAARAEAEDYIQSLFPEGKMLATYGVIQIESELTCEVYQNLLSLHQNHPDRVEAWKGM